jgi:hypothetical protein
MSESSLDPYESRYMDGGAALVRSKKRMPGWFFALLAGAAVAGLGGSVLAGGPLLPAVVSGVFSLALLTVVGVLFSHLRVVATATHLHVQLGVFGPTIAYAQIRSLRAVPYDWKRFGGWGIRRSLDGVRAYSVPGGNGECLEILWDDRGRRRTLVVSTDDAAAIVAAVERARAGATGVRVTAEAAAGEGAPAEGSAEATRAAERRGGRR